MAVAHRFECNGSNASVTKTPGVMSAVIEDVAPSETWPFPYIDDSVSTSWIFDTFDVKGRAAGVTHRGMRNQYSFGIRPRGFYFDIQVELRCGSVPPSKDRVGNYIYIQLYAESYTAGESVGNIRRVLKRKVVALDDYCSSDVRKRCPDSVWYGAQTKMFDAIGEFTVSFDTTSLGAFDDLSLGERGDDDAVSIMETASDALPPTTFRITSRRNCDSPVTCNCAASLRGMVVDLGNLKSVSSSAPSSYRVSSSLVDFVYMYDTSDQTVAWQGPFGFYEYDQNDPDGPQNGDGKFTRRLWRQRAELYCDVIDGVAQWFVLFTSFRDIYNEAGTSTHRSYDQWAGKIDCFKACEDLDNYIDADDPVPMGEPYDIEYLGRTTETGYLECEPPPRLTIRFTQFVTC